MFSGVEDLKLEARKSEIYKLMSTCKHAGLFFVTETVRILTQIMIPTPTQLNIPKIIDLLCKHHGFGPSRAFNGLGVMYWSDEQVGKETIGHQSHIVPFCQSELDR